jgi:hypothetical protein
VIAPQTGDVETPAAARESVAASARLARGKRVIERSWNLVKLAQQTPVPWRPQGKKAAARALKVARRRFNA